MRRLSPSPISIAPLRRGLALTLVALCFPVGALAERRPPRRTALAASDRRLGETGALDDWWTSETMVVDAKRLERALTRSDARFGPTSTRRRKGWSATCGNLGRLPLDRVPSWRKRAIRYQRATIEVARAQHAWIKVGGEGRTTLWVDGVERLDWSRRHHALLDDALVPIELTRGRHELLVRSVYPRFFWRYEPRLYVRLHDARHRPLRGVAVVGPRCDLKRDARFTLTLEPTRWGFRLRADVRLEGSHAALTDVAPTLELSAPPGLQLRPVARVLTSPRHGRRPSGTTLSPICKPPSRHEPARERCEPGRCTRADLRFSAATSAIVQLRWGPRSGAVWARSTETIVFRPAVHAALADAAAILARPSRLPRATLESVRYAYEHLRRLVAARDDDAPYLERLARELSQLTRALASGIDPYPKRRGHFLKAYCSPLDGRLQPYSLVVPKHHYDGKRPLPLIIVLHAQGSFPTLAVRRLFGHFVEKGQSLHAAMRHLPPLADKAALVVAPYSYGDTGGRYFGVRDLFRVLREVERDYRVDRRRIYLTGMSMGALETFHVGLRHPTRWAALATMAGYASVKLYRTMRGVTLYPFERPLLEEREDTNYGINGRYLPLNAWHGSRDDPYHSEAMVKVYREHHYRVEFQTPAWGHRVWQLGYRDGAIFKWLLRHRRPMRPKRLEFQSGGYRQRRYFWLRLDRFDTLEKLARVRAEIAKGKLTIRSANLRELTIDWQRAPSRVMAIRIDGQLLSLAPSPTRGPLPSSTTLHRGAARRWQLGPSPRAGLQKRPGLSGPIPDARYDPQLFVYGTQRDDETAINRMRAETDARFHSIRADVRMPVKRDRDVTAEDIARYHLVLYGTPAGNALLGTILAKTPLRVDAKGIRVGGARFEGRHLGVALIYPNPLNPQRYVVVLSGTSWRGVLATRYLPRWLPDYVVFDENGIHRQLGGKVMDKRRVRGGGFFDARWRFDPKRLWRPH